ncbi:MAG: transposase [Myxococcales bacterium]|nr:transposase [Myxococcales bacterium]MCB9576102.1 transposase [Polyangiaceae bacterium]
MRAHPSAPRHQLPSDRKRGWGGRRAGAGRPRRRESGVAHLQRGDTSADVAVHVTLRVQKHVYKLRSKRCFRVIQKAFAAWQQRNGFRLVHFAVMSNHVHLVAEAESRQALSRALQGISIRIAKGLNAVMQRRGKVFADRFFSRVVHDARDMRNVLAYVLNNARRHCIAGSVKKNWVDEFSSAHAFDGWTVPIESRAQAPPPVAPALSLIMQNWKYAGGLISPSFVPGPGLMQEHPSAR